MFSSPFFYFLLFSCFIGSIGSTKCHVCGGQERMSKLMKKAYTELNIQPDKFFGDCKAKEGKDVCSDGQFCIKRAKIHRFGFNSFNYKWTTYTKGCATRREDNNQTASVGCFDLNIDTKSTGYTTKRLDCYCTGDFCNSSTLYSLTGALIVMLWTVWKM